MTNKPYNRYFLLILVLLQLYLIISIPFTNAQGEIPANYNHELDLNTVYIYDIHAFNTSEHLEWADLDWTAPSKGFANTTPGGQLKINFTGFYDKNPNDFFNLFESPIPYMDIEFVINLTGVLTTNTTFFNISNGEAAQNLLLGYNKFKPGFLVPINSFSNLTQQAQAQDEPPFMNATVIVEETSTTISFEFKQKTFLRQNTTCIYDKVSGLLTYTNTTFGNFFLEMTLTNLPNLDSDSLSVPSYPILTVLLTTSIIIIIIIKLYNKNRITNFN
jgi:hypothetical protein